MNEAREESVAPRRGEASVEIARDDGASYVRRCRATSPLRLLMPRGGGEAAWIIASSFGGGLVDGDALDLDLTVGERAACLLGTQSSTKIYRGTSSQSLRARIAPSGTLLSLPDPVVPFAGAAFRQTTRVELQSGASLVLLDTLTAGRVARGERWASAHLSSALSIDVDGAPLLRDVIELDPAHGVLAERLGRFDATATVILLGPRFRDPAAALLSAVRGDRLVRGADVVLAVSPLGDGAIVRVAATTIALLLASSRALLGPACAAVGEDPWSRRW